LRLANNTTRVVFALVLTTAILAQALAQESGEPDWGIDLT